MKTIVLALALMACAKKSETTKTAETKGAPIAPVAVMQPDATPLDAAVATIVLPRERIDVHAILGATTSAVDKTLGKPKLDEDGIRRYDIGVLVSVEFEADRAGKIAIIGDMEPKNMTDADRDELLRWAGVDTKADDWGLDEDGLPQFVVWDRTAHARANERKRIGGLFGDYLEHIDAGSGQARGELDTLLLIRVNRSKCDRGILAAYRDEAVQNIGVDLKKLGFTALTCDLDGPQLKIH